ncbi:MAG: hypothetical protein H7Z19_04380 [Chitinophagaceae bacterium]|nr:hypothetical protein [Rubrivivax sp.]
MTTVNSIGRNEAGLMPADARLPTAKIVGMDKTTTTPSADPSPPVAMDGGWPTSK